MLAVGISPDKKFGVQMVVNKFLSLVDKIDKDRIVENLERLSKYSEDTNGSGITRLAYSEFDLKGKTFIAELMKEAGLQVNVSEIGNTIGQLAGSKSDDAIVLTGSHTDTVVQGGKYDGAIGVVCAIEALRVLHKIKDELFHPIAVVDWAMEEAARFGNCHLGSKVFVGEKVEESTLLLEDGNGVSLAEAISRADWSNGSLSDTKLAKHESLKAAHLAIENSRGQTGKIKAYIELHIEQSGELEEKEIPIGVVTTAAGPTRWLIEMIGEQAHSGSTAMNNRKNALLGAAQFVLAVESICKVESILGTVGTITRLNVEPNSSTVVPGKCSLFLDTRGTDAASKERVKTSLNEELDHISTDWNLDCIRHVIMDEEPIIFSPFIASIIKQSCESLSIPHIELPSRAGHDACTIRGKVDDVGMIFIPSRNGISHNPAEWSEPEHILLGTKVLLLSLLKLATG
jgi:allantoate deiminase